MLDKNKNKNQIPYPMKHPKTLLLSSLLAGSVLLTACGGGGSGGSSNTPSTNEDIVSTNPNTLLSGNDLNVNISAGVVDSFKATLNGTNITDLFDTSRSPAVATYNQVRSFLQDGTNTLVVEAGGDVDTETFEADIIPARPIITDAKGSSKGIVKPGDDHVDISGITRKDTLINPENGVVIPSFQSVSLYDMAFNEKLAARSFGFTSSLLATGVADSDNQADYQFDLTYADYDKQQKTLKTYYSANGRNLNTLGGIQINNSAFNALEPFLAEIISEVISENLPVFVELNASSEGCILETLPTSGLCGVALNDVDLSGDDLLDIKIVDPFSDIVTKNN
ncbi:MAG: hypothetical protein OXE99_10180, partial [Cellvibrionales bacterium]|nr:hypothetical protein [Cellvibrionales bacterium]